MSSILRPALVLFVILTVLCGFVYPLVVSVLAQFAFPDKAAGSLVLKSGAPVGSRLIGQSFTDPGHFWSRPSATTPQPYNGLASGASNLGPLNPALTDGIKARVEALKAADVAAGVPLEARPIPVDLVTASASGLDPEISLAAAYYQAPRVARVRGLELDTVRSLIGEHARRRVFGVLGEPRVNVLELNLALDELK
jgi:potassium-transporting ATPase KdpC subunit